ncbi:Arc family DNA-binding protein [Paracoccus yeei]|uniref:Arc family DNA-binding protein n=1 Tax=Paracoccus yeei TaxID=147645 RepID=UPI0036F2740A
MKPKDEQVSLRLPGGWRRALKIAAAMNGCSMNAEIVQRLRPTIEAADAQRQ